MEKIGMIIKPRRLELGINQQMLADLAGVEKNIVVAAERGMGSSSCNTLESILNTLGLTIDVRLMKR